MNTILRRVTIVIVLGVFFFAMLGVAVNASEEVLAPAEVCEELDSGKIDTTGDPASVTVTAPEGQLISGYCVFAGGQAYYTDVEPPAKTVVITHPSGKDVSHYSLVFTQAPPETTTTTVPETTTTTEVPESTTTTTVDTSTTTSTTTLPPTDTTTSTEPPVTTTTEIPSSTTTTPSDPEGELPNTGPGDVLLALGLAGLAMTGLGGLALRATRQNES